MEISNASSLSSVRPTQRRKSPKASAVGRIISTLLICSALAAAATPMASPSWLQVTLTFMPFSYYDYTHGAATSGFSQNLISSCPSGATVRSCFQTILQNMKSQEVSGVRIYVTFCDTNSLAFTGCGQGWQQISFTPSTPGTPSYTWMHGATGDGGVTAFLQDLKTYGIQNLTISAGSSPSSQKSVPKSQTTSPSGSYCSDIPDPVWFRDLECGHGGS